MYTIIPSQKIMINSNYKNRILTKLPNKLSNFPHPIIILKITPQQ